MPPTSVRFVSKTEARFEEWVAQVAGPGEPMVSWITLGYPTNPSDGGGRSAMDDHLAGRGLDPARQIGRGHQQLVAAITDSQLLIGSVGGFFTVKPKELLAIAPIASCRVEWWDQPQLGTDQRHLLFLLGPDWVRTSARIDERANTESFVHALGERAIHLPR